MRVVVANVQTPFVRGGAEMLADSLIAALRQAGHDAELITFPFKWYPASRIPEAMLAARLMEVDEWCGGPIDRLIGLKFPAYLIRHPARVMWLLHQYRGAYDLWGSPIGDLSNAPDGRTVRDAIRAADEVLIPKARAVFTISRNVSDRLKRFNGIDSVPLYHPPPDAGDFHTAPAEDFFLCPGRLNPSKRQHLVIEAAGLCREPIRIVFTGATDAAEYAAALRRSPVQAEWRGMVGQAEKLNLFARCLGVLVTPIDEDYGYVTLEAMLAAKPVITCTDSGGPLDFVLGEQTGAVCPPEPAALALTMDRLWADRARARRLGKTGLEHYHSLGLAWPETVERLLA